MRDVAVKCWSRMVMNFFRRIRSDHYSVIPTLPFLLLFAIVAIALPAPGAIPANDNFATRITLFGTNITTSGSNVSASQEPDEPDPSFVGGKSVWWSWTAPSDGSLTVSTAGSSFDTMISVFTGNVLSNLALVAFNDSESNTSIVTFNVSAGTAYQIAVDGALNETGTISLQLSLGATQPPPLNDSFANRIALVGPHINNVPGSNVGASAEPGEPYHADNLGLKSVWWTWTAPSSGGLTLRSQGSTFDTVTGIYTGNSVSSLTFVAGNDEDPLSEFVSRITCNVTAGTTYQIAVDGFEGEAGDIRLDLDLDVPFSTPANDNFANRTTLSGSDVTASGSNVGATFEAIGADFELGEPQHLVTFGGKSVWWSWTAPASGGVTLTTSNSTFDTVVAVYTGNNVSNLFFVAGNDEDYLTVPEGDSRVTFNAVAGTAYRIAVDGYDGDSGTVNLHLVLGAGFAVPANNNFLNRIQILGTNTTVTGANFGANLEAGEPLHDDSYGGKSAWWSWIAPGPGFVTVDTIGSDFDTILAVYTGTNVSALVPIASDDESGGNYTSRVTFNARSNVVYKFAVDGYDGDAGNISLHLAYTPASYSLTVMTNPIGGGSVSITPAPDQGATYAPGSVVTLTAMTNSGVLFTGWTGSTTTTTNPLSITMNANKSLTANFYVIPTTRVWSGGSGANGDWTTSQNWNEGTPNPGDALIFPQGAERPANNNDFPAGTLFKSITIGGADYVLSGNQISVSDGIVSTNLNATNTVNLAVQLNSNLTFRCTSGRLILGGNIALGNRTLTAEAIGDIALSGVTSGTGGIVKTNSGTLSLLGASPNTYSGATIVNQGTLELGKTGVAVPGPLTVGDGLGGTDADVVRFTANSQIGSSSAVTINNSGRLDLNGFTGSIGSLTMTSGNVTTGGGSLGLNGGVTVSAANASANISGNLTLQGGTRMFNVADGSAANDLVVSAVIGNGSGTGGITKTGGGTLQLSGANTYSGTTTLNDGTVTVLNASALGAAAQGTLINNGALLSISVSGAGEPLALVGGALQSDASSNLWTGALALTNSSVITVPNNGTLNLSGVISGPGSLSKNGDGTLFFSGVSNNTYSGATMVDQGVLLLGKTNSVPGALVIGDGNGGVNADVVRFTSNSAIASSSAVTVNNSGQLDLNGFSGIIGSLTMTSGNVDTGAGSLGLNGGVTANAASTQANITGSLLLQGGIRTFNVADGSAVNDLVVSAAIGNGGGTGGITKTGSGTLQLSGANTYSGATTLNDGTVAILNASALGTAAQGTLINNGALLSISGVSGIGEPLALIGGILQSDASSNLWTGAIALTNSSVITVANNGTLNLSGVITGPGSLTKSGTGTLFYSGVSNNTYSGATMVDQGVLLLGKTNSVPGALVIGDGNGGVNADVVRFTSNSAIASSSAVTVNSSGQLDLNGFTGTIGSLTMTSGNVDTGVGSLGLNGGVTATAANVAANITGNLLLQGATRTFNVGDGSGGTDLSVSANIGNGSGTGGIIKTGNGRLQFSGANTYSGTTTVSDGTLAILNASALGTTNQGTLVSNNSALILNGIAVIGEGLALSGGTLQSDGGSNFWSGNIQLTNSAMVTVATNSTVTLSNIVSGPGNLSKNGDGVLTFTGSSPNNYSGATTVNQGALVLSKTTSNAMVGALIIGDGTGGSDADLVRLDTNQQIALGSPVTVNSSGVLQLSNSTNSIGSISGVGHIQLNGGSASLSVGQDNSSSSFSGVISGSGALMKAGAGTLTLSGNNIYTGQTTVNNGVLMVNGAQPGSAAVVNSPGILGGSGRVGALSGSGTISPGSSPGVLLSGSATFASNTILRIELNGPNASSGYDRLSVVGTVHLAGTLNATLGYVPASEDSFTIINNDGSDPVVGTFNGLPEGSFLTIDGTQFQISYAAGSGLNDVRLSLAVPPQITCPSNITTNTASGLCSQVVEFAATISAGAPSPTVSYKLNGTPITSPYTFPSGTNTVVVTATNGVSPNATCSFNVIVADDQPPTITCPTNMTVTAASGCPVSVSFAPSAADNCAVMSLVANPPSGSTFATGENLVNVTATDFWGNTNTCSFTVTVLPGAAPELKVLRTVSDDVVLSWPASNGCFRLQFTSALVDPPGSNTWTTYSGLLSTNSGFIYVTNSPASNPQFYRLFY